VTVRGGDSAQVARRYPGNGEASVGRRSTDTRVHAGRGPHARRDDHLHSAAIAFVAVAIFCSPIVLRFRANADSTRSSRIRWYMKWYAPASNLVAADLSVHSQKLLPLVPVATQASTNARDFSAAGPAQGAASVSGCCEQATRPSTPMRSAEVFTITALS
jgi:hypothetical protein